MSKGEVNFKVVLLGDTFVGKTSLIEAFSKYSCPTSPAPTVNYSAAPTQRVTYNDWGVNLSIWDTAGQERYRHLVPFCLHGAHCCILVTDFTNKATFESIDYWMDFIHDNAPPDCFIVLCANKVDDVDGRQVDEDELVDRAEALEITFFKTSAKRGDGVTQLFELIVAELMKQPRSTPEDSTVVCEKTGKNKCRC